MIELFNIHNIFLEASFCAFICITLILVFLPQIDKNKNFEDLDFQNWKKRWQDRLQINKNIPEKNMELMKQKL